LLTGLQCGALLLFRHDRLTSEIGQESAEIIVSESPMKITIKWLFVLLLPLAMSVASGAEKYVEGVQYNRLETPQPTSVPDKIEVVEMFSYACPHCFHLDPYVNKWLKTKPDDVVFIRLPVVFRPQWEPLAKAYFTAQLLGVLDKTDTALFDAIHVKNQNLESEAALRDFFASQGVDPKEFDKVYNSFDVAVKVNHAKLMTKRYAITGVPTLIVDGKYSVGGEGKDVFKVVDYLIEQERKAGAPAPAGAQAH
jgi:thiol:disulfide interchange protein DsbA